MKKLTWQQRNREQYNAAWRRWYQRNAKRKYAWQKRRRLELRTWMNEYKSTLKCERCDERTPECLHFHHIDPATKSFEVSIGVAKGKPKQRILDEIAKCVVLCANCHLIHHWEARRRK